MKIVNRIISFALSVGAILCFTGCSQTEFEDFEDFYVEKLPDNKCDGVTFHAFNWTFNQIKDNLESLANSGFKNVLTMPVQQPKNGGSSWWAYYQPISFSIANNSALGTKEDLSSLCSEADKYGISIMVDVVANHLANISDDDLESDGTPKVSPSVAEYEPVIYNNRNIDTDGNGVTFHHNKNAVGSGAETQFYPYGNLPDLNTSNPYVQQRVLSLLKECIDVGVDGFRFDAAKHIETSKDSSYTSDFWENTLDVAKEYYRERTNSDLYVFGEILNSPIDRDITCYTDKMLITDDGYANQFKSSVISKDASKIVAASYKVSNAKNEIAWIESHDEYISSSSNYSEIKINKLWGVLSSRKDVGALYLGRPTSDYSVGVIGSYAFESELVGCSNRFHNRFIGAEEYLSSNESVFVNERVSNSDQAAYILNLNVTSEAIDVLLPHLNNGNYYDCLTGNKVVVVDHKASVMFDASGMCFLTRTNQKARPRYTISNRSGSFVDNLSIKITASNYEEGYYYFNSEENRYPLSDTTNISLKNHIDSNSEVNLHIYLKNGDFVIEKSFKYNQITLVEGYFNVVNLNPNYFIENEVYIWSWEPSIWSQNYIWQDGVLLVDTTGMTGFLIGIFEKKYVISNVNKWDENIIKQSSDIKGKTLKNGFYDAISL